ncbi:Casein kinase I [Wickerhamomyces ciferrii]|uniref:non-specific serine/threonine protein kinase n=1 Tax=Wickerhamomyces ciferrii (strain ATCC 14091 / BCRC 22168 / CBS 111 / JCM 3599 / NBRC 0793 / NRRL Y-1031 F-60-10) TaxID=1206466 RepID=K0KUS1_WICCF|nr:Casein kinase I [Wickerhamomyces ciferrii]CCH46956.1 Casein kinase I [Wickerhamomyces ciferrii]
MTTRQASAAAVAASSAAVNNIINTGSTNHQSHHQSHQQISSNNTSNSNTNNNSSSNNSTIVGLHYKIGKKIGEGSFGVIFEGINMINQIPVAIKFEPRKTEAPQLRDEYRTYKHLNGSYGIPQAYYFGQEGLHNILVIDLLGPSLEDLFDWCGRRFSVKTTVQVAVQMITLIETLHANDLIYRDIKPDNFLVGRPGQIDENQIHLVDFGMAKHYRDPRTKQHNPYREKKSLSGTARYMSINTHLGREQSRRDDLEALGHVFFYFLRGQLPWQGLKAPTNKQKYEKIGEKKRTTVVNDLSIGLPNQFAIYLETVRKLSFEETPNYEGYRQLLLSALTDIGETADGKYDWMKLNGGKGWDLSINKKPNLHGYGHPNPPNEKDRHHRHQQQQRNKRHNQQIPIPVSNHIPINPKQQQPLPTTQPLNPQMFKQQPQPPSSQQQQQQQQQQQNELNTSNALNQQQFQNKQPTPIREKVNSSSGIIESRTNNINQQLNDDESVKKSGFKKFFCCA